MDALSLTKTAQEALDQGETRMFLARQAIMFKRRAWLLAAELFPIEWNRDGVLNARLETWNAIFHKVEPVLPSVYAPGLTQRQKWKLVADVRDLAQRGDYFMKPGGERQIFYEGCQRVEEVREDDALVKQTPVTTLQVSGDLIDKKEFFESKFTAFQHR